MSVLVLACLLNSYNIAFGSFSIQNPILLKFILSFFLWKDFMDNSNVCCLSFLYTFPFLPFLCFFLKGNKKKEKEITSKI